MKTDPKALRTVLVTDCGSTTTKALLFQKTPEGWRQTHRGEAPTTVEQPVADVTVGALNAFHRGGGGERPQAPGAPTRGRAARRRFSKPPTTAPRASTSISPPAPPAAGCR